jgi:hypothetical protein
MCFMSSRSGSSCAEPLTLEGLTAVTAAYEEALSRLDPNILVHTQPIKAMDLLVRTANKVSAAKMAVAARVADTGGWTGQGHRTKVDWLAAICGITYSEARRILDTADKLQDLPEVRDAIAKGDLSDDQAQAVTRGAHAQPDQAGEMVDKAKTSTMRQLNDAANDAEAAAAGPDRQEQARRRAHQNRSAHAYYNGQEGKMVITDSVDRIAQMMAAINDDADTRYAQHRKTGEHQPPNWYRADAAFDRLTRDNTADTDADSNTRDGQADANPSSENPADRTAAAGGDAESAGTRKSSGGVGAEVVVILDLNLLRQDDTADADATGSCKIKDVGPVSPALARQWIMSDAFLKVVLTDGVDIQQVWHGGRHVSAEQKTALMVRDQSCVVPGCGRTFDLEMDHIDPFADGGATAFWNLRRPCTHHHRMRTHNGWDIQGIAGDWRWVDPHNVIIAATNPDLIGRTTRQHPAPAYQPPDNYTPGTTNIGRTRTGPAQPASGNRPDPEAVGLFASDP